MSQLGSKTKTSVYKGSFLKLETVNTETLSHSPQEPHGILKNIFKPVFVKQDMDTFLEF